MKEKKISRIVLDWISVICIIYTLVWGIITQIETGLPFSDSPIAIWVLWIGWAFFCGASPVKRIFGGHKNNG